jgi:hypothetical protein
VPGEASRNAVSAPSFGMSSGTRCARIAPTGARIVPGPDGAVRRRGDSHPPL